MITNIKETRNEKNCDKNIVMFPGEYGKMWAILVFNMLKNKTISAFRVQRNREDRHVDNLLKKK